jgi:hypothetical protein
MTRMPTKAIRREDPCALMIFSAYLSLTRLRLIITRWIVGEPEESPAEVLRVKALRVRRVNKELVELGIFPVYNCSRMFYNNPHETL